MQLDDLHAWVAARKPEIEAALKTLVEINTYTANTAGVDAGMDVLSKLAQEKGLVVEAINARHRLLKAVRAANGSQPRPRILLIAHMDTVFPPEGDFQHYEVLDDEFVRGPGVGDIKGGLLVGFYAMLAIRELCESYDVQMVVSADEETGSPTIRDWYMGGHIGADYAIGLEPGFPQAELSATVDLGVVHQRRGYGAIRFKVTGKDAHSGTPHLGLNALEAMAQRITRLHTLNKPEQGISVNVGIMSGGISPNTVPGEAEATVSFRYERMIDGEETKAAIESIIRAKYLNNPALNLWDSAQMQVEAFIPPMERTPQNERMVELVLAEAKRLGHNVVPIARGGGSDANFISATGTASICGMGAPAQGIHTIDEKIHLPMMLERVNLLASVLYRLIQQ